MKKILLLATVADRIDMAEIMICSAKQYLPEWEFLVVAQEYTVAEKLRLESALAGAVKNVVYLEKRIGPHIAKCNGLDQIDFRFPSVICSVDDDMEFIAQTNIDQCVAKAMQYGVGLVSAGWVHHESLLNKRKTVDEFVKQKIVYTGGGMFFSSATAKIIKNMQKLPYFSDNAMWSLTCYLEGLENYRYRGSLTIHRVCRKGGRKAWVLLGDKALPPKEYLHIDESKDAEKFKIPVDKGITDAANKLHKQRRIALCVN